jgi:succinyl-CoA synthetase beta subunit
MNLHEYQAKELFARFGLPVLPGQVATTPEEARDVAAAIGGTVVVKAQVQAGGRGKAGGVKLAHSPDEAMEHARAILALTIKGLRVQKVLVARAAEIARELYFAIVLDRTRKLPLVMLSAEGGVEIEEVARTAPKRSYARTWPGGSASLSGASDRSAAVQDSKQASQAADILLRLWSVYRDGDCTLAEINPLAVTPGAAARARREVILDDSTEFRHREWDSWRDPSEETPGVRLGASGPRTWLDGDIGCIVNGAGLAMATMDLVQYYGGEPANSSTSAARPAPRGNDRAQDHHR